MGLFGEGLREARVKINTHRGALAAQNETAFLPAHTEVDLHGELSWIPRSLSANKYRVLAIHRQCAHVS